MPVVLRCAAALASIGPAVVLSVRASARYHRQKSHAGERRRVDLAAPTIEGDRTTAVAAAGRSQARGVSAPRRGRRNHQPTANAKPLDQLRHEAFGLGLLDEVGQRQDVPEAIAADETLTKSQKTALLEIYSSFIGNEE